MTDLNELLERVREAKGPDKVLDLDIAAALFTDGEDASWWAARKARFLAGHMLVDAAPEYTASIDASLALGERLLGDGWYSIMLDAIRELGANGVEPPNALPRYILAALLTALKELR